MTDRVDARGDLVVSAGSVDALKADAQEIFAAQDELTEAEEVTRREAARIKADTERLKKAARRARRSASAVAKRRVFLIRPAGFRSRGLVSAPALSSKTKRRIRGFGSGPSLGSLFGWGS